MPNWSRKHLECANCGGRFVSEFLEGFQEQGHGDCCSPDCAGAYYGEDSADQAQAEDALL
jgi:hypothetical protein